jgi:hypothetical protein
VEVVWQEQGKRDHSLTLDTYGCDEGSEYGSWAILVNSGV